MEYVRENEHVKDGLTHDSIIWAFTTGCGANWHPLTWLSHELDCELFGVEPGAHHLTNLLFHLINTLLLFWFLKGMTGAVWRSAFVAAAFALHPLHVESVAWISERKDVLSTLFWMLTMAAYLRYVNQRGSLGWYLLALLAFAVGLTAKPMLVTLPFVLLLLDYWPLERFQNGQLDEGSNDRNRKHTFFYLVREKVPFFALSAASSVVTFFAERSGGSMAAREWVPVTVRISNTFISYMKYIGKTVWPSRLAVFYPHPHKFFLLPAILSALLLVAITIWMIYAGRKHKYLPVGWLWYLGTLVPVIGLVQVGQQAMADRYTYIPLIGLFVIIAWGLPELFVKWRSGKIILGVLAVTAVVALSTCTYLQIRHWRDSETLFQHAIDVTENNYVAHFCIAGPLGEAGEIDWSIYHNRQSLRIRPGYVKAQIGLGIDLVEVGKFDEAVIYLTEAQRQKPDSVDILANLGVAHARLNQFEKAVEYYNEALRIKPDYADAHSNLGYALAQQGKLDDAIIHFNKALELEPNSVEAHINFGAALLEQGNLNEAIEHYTDALQIDPDLADAHYNLGYALARQGKLDEAAGPLTSAVKLDPNSAQAHYLLAQCLIAITRTEQAVIHFKEALRLKPDWIGPMNHLARVLAARKDHKFYNPQQAVQLAERACELTAYNQPKLLDTLAVAYAAAGEFSRAVTTAEKAVKLAQAAGKKDLARQIRNRLQLYRAGQPYCQPSPTHRNLVP